MALTIRAHYDGKVFVPDEPVELPVNEMLELEVKSFGPLPKDAELSAKRAALEQFLARPVQGAQISDESLRREHLYEERH